MEAFWWLFAIVLMALGLIGTVIPIVPGTTIILAAAVVHRVALGADRSLGMSALIAMLVLTLVTYAIDAAAGYLGAKRFGATKWGLIGGAAGALLGLFFGLLGLFVGPVIGAIAGELIGGKQIMKAGRDHGERIATHHAHLPGDRCDRGRTYWREGSHESWSRGLGHISGRSGRRHRKTFHRAHYDCDLSDERAVTIIRRAPPLPSSLDFRSG